MRYAVSAPLLTAIACITLVVCGVCALPRAASQIHGGTPCDPFAEDSEGQGLCEADGTGLMQKTAAKLKQVAEAAHQTQDHASSSLATGSSAISQENQALSVPVAAASPRGITEDATPACLDGYALLGITPTECPTMVDLPSCNAVSAGELCEGDGECGTRDDLDNCGTWDVYRKGAERPLAVQLGERLAQGHRRTRASKPTSSAAAEYPLAKQIVDNDEYLKIAEANGRFWGLSRDCWIIIGFMVAGFAVCALTILSSVALAVGWRAAWINTSEIEYSSDDPKAIKEPSFPVGFLQRVVFRHDLNDDFAYRADLATRCAIASSICALTYWVESLNFMNEKGWSMQYVIVIIIFTVYNDIGQTAKLAWENLFGTLLPTINVIFIYGLYEQGVVAPEGADSGSQFFTPAWWMGVIDFVLFCGLNLVFNVSVGVRMFALSWQAYFSMCFLNPTDTTKFSHGLRDVILEGAAVGPLVGTIFGCVIGIMVVMPSPLGYCFCGLGQAQESSITIAWNLGEQCRRTIEYYTGAQRTLEIDKIIGEGRLARQEVQIMKQHLSCTWWECFDLGRAGRVKAHLDELAAKFGIVTEWFRGAVDALRTEDFDEQHTALMERVRAPLEELSHSNAKLLYRATQAACSGFSPSCATGAGVAPTHALSEQLKLDIDAVNAAQRELARAFTKARKEVYNKDQLGVDAVSEHFFCFFLSTISSHTVEYAEYLLEDRVASRPTTGALKACWQGLISSLTPNSNSFIMRSFLSFFGAWILGYHGIAGVMAPYSSTAAGTTAFLMAAEGKGGSALLKNVARFQGTAGGTILGQLLYTVFISCSALGAFLGFVTMGILQFFGFYLYQASSEYGYVGVLFAAYGAMNMVTDCDSKVDHDVTGYNTIIDQFLAIACISLGDLVVQNQSAGRNAANHYHAMCKTFIKAFSTLLGIQSMITAQGFGMSEDLEEWQKKGGAANILERSRLMAPKGAKDYVKALSHKDELQASFVQAMDMGVEAPLEPRFFRLPWKDDLWKEVMTNMEHVAVEMTLMEFAVHDNAKGDRDTSQTFKAITSSSHLKKKSTTVVKRARLILDVAEKVLKRESLQPMNITPETMHLIRKMDYLSVEDAIPEIVEEIDSALPESPSRKGTEDSLVQDDYCLISVVLLMVGSIAERINMIEKACFATPDITIEDN